MPRKRTKEEALERLFDVPDVPGLKGKAGAINRLELVLLASLC